MIKHVAFFVYPVTDMARARRFYETVLGLKEISNYDNQWVQYDLQGATFAISTRLESTRQEYGNGLALEVQSVDSVADYLRSQHVQFLKEPFSTEFSHMAVVADPDGNRILLHQTVASAKNQPVL